MEKILIIDDSRLHTAQLKSILEDDYEVTVAHTATEGLTHAREGEFSLILLDVVMPEMDGFTLLKKLQEEVRTKSVPVILITSLSDIKDEQRGFLLGAVDYITKPFHPLIVKARINTHVKLYNYRREVEFQSRTDQLTGIPNRRQHDIFSRIKWDEARRLQVPFSVCMFDIDHFKVYNDTFGHPAGDKVITSVAQTIDSHLKRSTDFFARYGGEEFVAFLMGENAERTFEYVRTIRQSVEDLHIPHSPSVSEWVTISIGGATIVPGVEDTYAHCLQIADDMLYDAKARGRNIVVWADEKMRKIVEENR